MPSVATNPSLRREENLFLNVKNKNYDLKST